MASRGPSDLRGLGVRKRTDVGRGGWSGVGGPLLLGGGAVLRDAFLGPCGGTFLGSPPCCTEAAGDRDGASGPAGVGSTNLGAGRESI